MENVRVGPHVYRPRTVAGAADAPLQACVVCGVNEDGSANIMAFDAQCDAFAIKGAVMAKDSGERGCHYTDPEPVVHVVPGHK